MATGRAVMAIGLMAASSAAAQNIAAAPHAEPAPGELAAPVREAMAGGGTRTAVRGVTVDFWWVKSLALARPAGGPVSWSAVAEGTLVGAVRFSAPFRDIRGRIVKPGVYTLRYGIQPDNGDHLGVSPHREFLLMSPATADADVAPTGHEGTIAMARQSIGAAHPGVLSLDPPVAADPPLTIRANDAGHELVVFELPTSHGAPLRFGLILVGKIEA